ncbi:MAG: biopolymer transporter ExbD [Myxococcota bacterium]
MPRRRLSQQDEETIQLTPMLDVVFIMLIFFIVTASFVKESGIQVERPNARTAEPKVRASILIAISRSNEIWIQKKRVDVRSVRASVERLLAENPRGSVVIQADRRSKNGLFVKVMDQARLAGAHEIAIATREGPL